MDEGKRNSYLKSRIIYGLSVLTLTFLGYSAYIYITLPSVDNIKKCFTTSMYKVKLCPGSKDYVRLKNIPKILQRSLILSEDAAFYSHKGLDWFEIKQSFKRNWEEGRIARGGSTITQQLAKNLYLSGSRTPGRKIQEFFLAQRIEEKISKLQILEKYFNVVEFGDNIFGIKKAAKYYFNKPVNALNLLESVYLVSLLPSPKLLGSSRSSKRLSDSNIWRMKVVLRRLYRTNNMTEMLYQYCLRLVEEQTWPFPIYNEYDVDQQELEMELAHELESLGDDSDTPSASADETEAMADEYSMEQGDDYKEIRPASTTDTSFNTDDEAGDESSIEQSTDEFESEMSPDYEEETI